MLKSMTGFGRSEDVVGGRHIVFEMRAVNHKYFEYTSRLPRGYLFLDEKLKSFFQGKIARGKLDVFLQLDSLEEAGVQVTVNHSLASGYLAALMELKKRYALPDKPTLALLSHYPDLFSIHKSPENEEELWEVVRQTAEKAVSSFLTMREAEGTRLKEDILSRAERIIALVGQIESLTPQTQQEYRQRLQSKVEELLGEKRYDEQRILTEVAIFADKIAVDEETVRLRSHFHQLQLLLESPDPVGRKIDFLVQEMNREANTIASKSVNAQVAYLVVDIKSEIEKIREQIQNIE